MKKLFVYLIVSSTICSCDNNSHKKTEDEQNQSSENTFDEMDFVDNTEKHKGEELNGFVVHPLSIGVNTSLRDYVGETVDFFRSKSLGAPSDYHIFIKIPAGMKVPNASFSDNVLIAFKCTEGSLKKGNIATEITRP